MQILILGIRLIERSQLRVVVHRRLRGDFLGVLLLAPREESREGRLRWLGLHDLWLLALSVSGAIRRSLADASGLFIGVGV
jgi:hypothetical protein